MAVRLGMLETGGVSVGQAACATRGEEEGAAPLLSDGQVGMQSAQSGYARVGWEGREVWVGAHMWLGAGNLLVKGRCHKTTHCLCAAQCSGCDWAEQEQAVHTYTARQLASPSAWRVLHTPHTGQHSPGQHLARSRLAAKSRLPHIGGRCWLRGRCWRAGTWQGSSTAAGPHVHGDSGPCSTGLHNKQGYVTTDMSVFP